MKAIVWSKDMCPYCDQAKALLVQKGIEVEERKLGHGWTKEQLLEAIPTAKSVPQIYLNDEYIGGFQQLQSKFDKEKILEAKNGN